MSKNIFTACVQWQCFGYASIEADTAEEATAKLKQLAEAENIAIEIDGSLAEPYVMGLALTSGAPDNTDIANAADNADRLAALKDEA